MTRPLLFATILNHVNVSLVKESLELLLRLVFPLYEFLSQQSFRKKNLRALKTQLFVFNLFLPSCKINVQAFHANLLSSQPPCLLGKEHVPQQPQTMLAREISCDLGVKYTQPYSPVLSVSRCMENPCHDLEHCRRIMESAEKCLCPAVNLGLKTCKGNKKNSSWHMQISGKAYPIIN